MSHTPNPRLQVYVSVPLPQRSAARKASTVLTGQLKPAQRKKSATKVTTISSDEPDINEPMDLRISGQLSSSSLTSKSPSPSTTRARKRPAKTYGKKSRLAKRPRTPSPATEPESSLSSVTPSPPPASPPPKSRTISQNAATTTRKRIRNEDDGNRTPSKRSKASKDKSTFKPTSGSFTNSKPISLDAELLEGPWRRPLLGTLVFIKMDENASVISVDGWGFWWPAKVARSSGDSFEARLLGRTVPGGPSNAHVVIPDPGIHNVRSFRRGRSIRYTSTTFVEPGSEDAGTTSSRSSASDRVRALFETNFGLAFTEALEQDQEDNDGLPDPSFVELSQPATPSKAKNTSKANHTPGKSGKGKSIALEPSEIDKPEWRPDSDLTPGTAVFSKDKKGSKHYWPAKVEEVIPGPKVWAQGKYGLIFFDGSKKAVPREWIYTQYSDEFLTCQLGDFAAPPEEVEQDCRQTPIPRSPSPQPPPTAPTDDEFEELSLREQVSCIRPILQQIIERRYPEAKARHDAFIAGGKQRQALSLNFITGDFTDNQIAAVSKEVRRWALRGERWAKRADQSEGVDGVNGQPMVTADQDTVMEPAHESDPLRIRSELVVRPTGCSEYEALGGSARSQYCSDVLLQEALIQLHALRKGLRQGTIPLEDDAKEEELYRHAAKTFADEKPADAWFEQILAMRRAGRIRKGLDATDSAKESPLRGTTRSRRAFN